MIPLLQIGPPPGVSGPPDGFGDGPPGCFPPPCIPVGEYLLFALLITSILLYGYYAYYKEKCTGK